MKLTWIHFLALIILVPAFVWAQQPSNATPPTLAYENGSITNNVYRNECFGISLAIPDGWLLMKQLVAEGGKARHMPGGERTLLMMGQHKVESFGSRIVVTAHDTNGSVLSVKDFVSNAAHGQVNLDPEHTEILKDVYPVDFGRKQFFRADYKHSLPNGGALYQSFVYTIFRGYFIGETLVAESPEELEQAANSLQHIAFREDEQNPNCVIRGEDNPSPGGIIGVISSKSNTSQSNSGLPQRVSIPQEVSKGLQIKKVPAQYPQLAQQARIQGRIDLDVLINKEGHVRDIVLISGHPMLAPAAINAVKQWEYKPYLVNGQPVEIETQVVVIFDLK